MDVESWQLPAKSAGLRLAEGAGLTQLAAVGRLSRSRGIMDPDTTEVAAHMRDFGLYTLGRAVYDATFAEVMKPYAHAGSVTLAAHAGEIIVKARIAEQHPLLIFENLPKSTAVSGMLRIKELIEHGKTVSYFDLPELLWAATGYRMRDPTDYLQFGKLRNAIAHFAVPEGELADETLKYVFEVIDPLVGDFWSDSVIPYAHRWDDEVVAGGYLQDRLIELSIEVTNPGPLRALAEFIE